MTSAPHRRAMAYLALACVISPFAWLGTASAAPGETYAMRNDRRADARSYGNNLFGAGYDFRSNPTLYHVAGPTGWMTVDTETDAQLWYRLFGTKKTVASLLLESTNKLSDDEFDLRAFGRAFINGQMLFYQADYDPDGNYVAKVAFGERISKTFYSASYSTSISFVPVTLRGSVRGAAEVGVGAQSVTFIGGYADNSGLVTGNLHGVMSLIVGIPDVLAAGLTGGVTFIDVRFEPTASSQWYVSAPDEATYTWGHKAPMTLSSLDGYLKGWVDITPFVTVSETFLNWKGISQTTNLWNTRTTEVFRNDIL